MVAPCRSDLGMALNPDKTFTLQKALQMGLTDHLQIIVKISDVASKEHSIEQVWSL